MERPTSGLRLSAPFGNNNINMNHKIAIVIELCFGVILLVRVLFTSRQAERWVMNALLCVSAAFLLYGTMGAIIDWHLVRISPHQFMVAVSVRSGIGGIALGVIISLILSGQMRKLFNFSRTRLQEE